MIIYLEDWQFIVLMVVVALWGVSFLILSISELTEILFKKKKYESGE